MVPVSGPFPVNNYTPRHTPYSSIVTHLMHLFLDTVDRMIARLPIEVLREPISMIPSHQRRILISFGIRSLVIQGRDNSPTSYTQLVFDEREMHEFENSFLERRSYEGNKQKKKDQYLISNLVSRRVGPSRADRFFGAAECSCNCGIRCTDQQTHGYGN